MGTFPSGLKWQVPMNLFCSEIKSKNKSELDRNDQTGIISAVIIKIMWDFFFFNDSPVIVDVFSNTV